MDIETIKPFSNTNNVACLYQVSDLYAPYCCVSIASILAHATPEHNYDIVILTHDMGEFTKKSISEYVQRHKRHNNISLRFYDVKKVAGQYKDQLPSNAYFAEDKFPQLIVCAYWFSVQIFDGYEKVIRLGADTMLTDDVAKLYNQDIGENYLGGVAIRSSGIAVGMKEYADLYEKKFGKTVEEVADLYINADVQTLNLTEWRKHGVLEKLLKESKPFPNGEWPLIEQDVINYVCHGRIYYYGQEWNTSPFCYDVSHPCYHDLYGLMTSEDQQRYTKAIEEPKLVHFAAFKPWHEPTLRHAALWWEYARTTPFYEVLLARLLSYKSREKEKLMDEVKKLQIQFKKKSLHQYLSWGKRKESRRKKIAAITERIKLITNYLKTLS